jgi:hypothetical protein
MPSGGACGGETNLFSSGARSARPIGVNVPMTSPQADAAANQAEHFDRRSTAQKAAIAPIKTRAFVGAANSQNILETW